MFIQELESKFQAYLNRSKQEEGIRLYISNQVTHLSKIPWETLCSQETPVKFLALDPKTPIIRCPPVDVIYVPENLRIPLKLLVFLASPRHVTSIDREKEKSSLEQALSEAIHSRKIIIKYSYSDDKLTEASFCRLQKLLVEEEDQYQIVHIIGHGLLEAGQEGIIAFEQPEDGKQQNVSASSLANVFRSRGVKLVILQSCQSGAVDQSLPFSNVALQIIAAGVPAVLAMQEPIDQDVARCFINKLYEQWIGTGCLFEDALTQARQSVYQNFKEKIASWAIPVLYMAPNINLKVDNTIVDNTIGSVETNRQHLEAALPQQVVETNRRHLEAALPQQVCVGKETRLFTLVRSPAMKGLENIIGANSKDYDDVTPEDIRTSSNFEVTFPVNEKTGKASPTSVKIVIETSDFDMEKSEKEVQVVPFGESSVCIFRITPKKEGYASLLINVLDNQEQITLANLPLRVKVQEFAASETEYRVVGTDHAKRALWKSTDFSEIAVRYNVTQDKEMTPEEAAEELYPKDPTIYPIAKAIFEGEEDDVVEGLEKAISSGKEPMSLIDDALMVGMGVVTRLYDEGVIFLPNVMMSADAMLEGIEYVKQKAGKSSVVKGKVVCHVAEGDIHDIGKGIVVALLRANGYDVVDLGRDVPVDKVIAAVEKEKPLMLTGTALMTTTMYAFKEVNDKLLEKGYRIPFACGGGAVNQDFVSQYELGVYGEEAADVPKIADFIREHGDDIAQLRQKFHKH